MQNYSTEAIEIEHFECTNLYNNTDKQFPGQIHFGQFAKLLNTTIALELTNTKLLVNKK